jgi:hypothetical protein
MSERSAQRAGTLCTAQLSICPLRLPPEGCESFLRQGEMNEIQFCMRFISSFSCLSCLSVICLYLSCDSISKKRYNQLIYYIAISDFFSAVGGLFGYSTNGTFRCYIQSFLTNYFPLTSIFWTVVITYLLFDILQKPHLQRKKTMEIDLWVHLVCWGLPLLLTLLPLTTTDYGTFDGEDGWCFLRPRNGSPKWTFHFWLFVAFFAWVYIAILIFSLFLLYVAYVTTSPSGYLQTDSIISSTIHKAIRKLVWYPLIILVSWFVMTIYELWAGFYPNEPSLSDPTFMYLTFTLPLFSGLLTTAAFFSGSHEAQQVILHQWRTARKVSSLFTTSTQSVESVGERATAAEKAQSSESGSDSSPSNALSPLISSPVLTHEEVPNTSVHNVTTIPLTTWIERSSEATLDHGSAA